MIQQIRIADWLLEVDVDKTREFYSRDNGIDVCDCLYCNNFVEACKPLDNSVKDVFNELGINLIKPRHLSAFHTEENGIYHYIGVYHLVGRVLEGEMCTMTNWGRANTFQVENFTFGFSEDLEDVADGFPPPILQLSFDAEMPWMLRNEKDDMD